ncbi:Hypothetical predicted protein [Xyrichtys novacula]|uniref:Uncharacterized protein n=1 Tax=Xyrichtys novacula TaxID=13765 RepID=A0AAV1HQV4_XYRNO|nr:Hypothetical predicted protein [Xyrichtys novacula]
MAELEAKTDTVQSRLIKAVDSMLGKIDSRIASMDTCFAGVVAQLDNLQCEVSGF